MSNQPSKKQAVKFLAVFLILHVFSTSLVIGSIAHATDHLKVLVFSISMTAWFALCLMQAQRLGKLASRWGSFFPIGAIFICLSSCQLLRNALKTDPIWQELLRLLAPLWMSMPIYLISAFRRNEKPTEPPGKPKPAPDQPGIQS